MKKILLLLHVLIITNVVIAQKLPNIQTTSLRAPANIKVDGKATEWNNKFQAYNKAVEASYTVANDAKNLYLILHVTDRDIIHKIINSGVSFTINSSGKKTDKDGITVTYPRLGRENRPSINLKNTPVWSSNPAVAKMQADSFMNVNNNQLTKIKEIKTSGIKDVDSLISIYNQNGIKAAGLFDNKMAFTVEMAIDLKLLKLSGTTPDKVAYHVKLNALSMDYTPGINITRDANGEIKSLSIIKDQAPRNQTVMSDTDFWGEYTLAK